MKTKRICKSTVSLLLVFMMLVSMLTVGIVNASAAETDVATTGAGNVRILFRNDWQWTDIKIYYAGSSGTNPTWDGRYSMKSLGEKSDNIDLYYYDIPDDATVVVFTGNDNGAFKQSPDLKKPSGGWNSTTCYYMAWNNGDYIGSKQYYADYFLTGSFNNWATNNNDYKFSKAGTETKYTLTKELSAGTYSFKIFGSGGNDDGNYYSNTGTITDTTGNNAWSLTNVDNCTLKASGGTYTFTLVTSSDGKKLTVTHTSSGGGNEGGGDDGGDTTGDTTIYVGVISYIFSNWGDNFKTNFLLHYWNDSNLTGDKTYTDLIDTDSTQNFSFYGSEKSEFKIFKVTIPAATDAKVYWKDPDGNFEWAADSVKINKEKIILIYERSYNIFNELADFTPTDAPTDVKVEKETTNTIQFIDFVDKVNGQSLTKGDPKLFAHDKTNNKVYEMTKTIDTDRGYDMWVATLEDTADTNTQFDFYRTSIFGTKDNVLNGSETGTWWGKWSAGKRGLNISYVATSLTEGMWSNNNYPAPTGTMRDLTYGIWVDTKGNGDVADATVARKVSDDVYHLYLPSHSKDIETLDVYTSFYGAKLTGGYYTDKKLVRSSANSISFRNGTTTYEVKDGALTYTLKVYKSDNVSTLFMNTDRELFTQTIMSDLINGNAWPKGTTTVTTDKDAVASEYKDAIETSGTYVYYDENGKKVNADTELKKIKGRGNSTFKASMEIYGKYAYNITLGEKEELIPGATKSSKWCLLANNVDHTMMRNTFIYSVAEDIGLKYAPKTQLLDVYNKGQYLGAYVITEKVEYGSGTLMHDLKNLDKANETACENAGEKAPKKSATITGNYNTQSGNYSYQCKSFTGPNDYNTYNFVLEFELFSRYENEASWFVSPRTGQAVVVKYPEYANEEQMKWIIDQYEAVERLIYTNKNASLSELSKLIDVDSFVKMYLIQELSLNLDAGATSFYIHNQFTNADHTESVLYASPVWDYDWSMGAYSSTSESGKKYFFDGTTTQKNTTTMDNPEQMFINKKALQTDSDHTGYKHNYNFQAMLTKNANYWKECQLTYTNLLVPTMDEYIYNLSIDGENGYDENDKMLSEWLPKFKSSVTMNNARWGAFTHDDTWGTKFTSKYAGFGLTSMTDKKTALGVGQKSVGSATSSFNNTVYYLNDWLAIRWNYLSSTKSDKMDQLYLKDDRYRFEEDLTFTLSQNGHIVTIDPYAVVEKNDVVLDEADVTVVVYLNGVAQKQTYTLADIITLPLAGGTYSIYLEAYPTDYQDVIQQSETKNVNVTTDGELAKIEIRFKCSDSYRYTPTITCGDTSVVMTKIDEVIAQNPSTAQSYYWYTATVEAVWGESMTVNFKNLLKMDATYIIDEVRSEVFYLAVDNMNTGSSVVDLTAKEEHIRNACKSAVNMVVNDPTAEGLTTTSFDGGHYVVGDTDINGTLSIMDVTLIQMALAQKKQLTDTAEKLADFNLDGTTSINDATGVQIYIAQ